MKGEEVAREVLSVLSTEFGVPSNQLLAACMHHCKKCLVITTQKVVSTVSVSPESVYVLQKYHFTMQS